MRAHDSRVVGQGPGTSPKRERSRCGQAQLRPLGKGPRRLARRGVHGDVVCRDRCNQAADTSSLSPARECRRTPLKKRPGPNRGIRNAAVLLDFGLPTRLNALLIYPVTERFEFWISVPGKG